MPLVSAYYSNFDMQNIVKSINQKLEESILIKHKQFCHGNNHPIFLDYFLYMEKKNKKKQLSYLRICLPVIIKTVNYVHYISNHATTSRHQITLFGILFWFIDKAKMLFIFENVLVVTIPLHTSGKLLTSAHA